MEINPKKYLIQNLPMKKYLKKSSYIKEARIIELTKSWIEYQNQRNVWFSKKFFDLFGKKRKTDTKITTHHKNIAAALQSRLEEVFIKMLRYLKKKTKMERLCLAGGVALNCSMNGKIHDKKMFKEIFIQPASSDSGIAVGAAIIGFLKKK